MEIKTSEFFANMKSLPPEGSKEFDDLVDWELEKCKGGVTVNSVKFSGYLYFLLNHWWIGIDKFDDYGNIVKEELHPHLRDNEWIRAEALEQAQAIRKGYIEVGARQTGKSEMEAAMTAYNATMFKNSQNVVVGSSSDDLDMIKAKIDFGLKKMWKGIAIPRLDKDWRKSIVRLGYKKKNNEDDVWSYLVIRNTKDGKDTEGPAGTTAKSFIYDEIGKAPFSQVFAAAKPAFNSEFGWRCTPVLVGCVCAGTKVWNNSGNLLDIENLSKDEGILGYNKNTQEISKEDITYWQSPYEKECYRLTTNTGRYLECSEDHPILHRSRNEMHTINLPTGGREQVRKLYFKEMCQLKVGDQIAVIEEVPIFGENKMWEPRLVGWLIGDGSYGIDKTPRLSNCDEYIINYTERNFCTKVERSHTTKLGKEYKEIRIKNICPKLRELGIYGQTKLRKTLPTNIHSFTKEDICELLGGIFDTDGTVIGENGIPAIELASMSKSLLLEIQLLLQKIGIHGGVRRVKLNPNNPKDKNDHFRLSVCDKRSISSFYENIKFSLEYKQATLGRLVDKLKLKKEKIPKEIKGLRFERITDITSIGKQFVYNLTAGNTHTYIANGIVTHNTGGAFEKGEDAERFFYNPDANNFLSFTDPETLEKTGLFMSGIYRQDCKDWTTLDKYLLDRGYELTDTEELAKIPIKVANKEKALEKIKEERELKAKDPDQTEYLKEIMYHPLTPQECFLSSAVNFYNAELARQQKKKLTDNNITGSFVFLKHDGEKIIHEFTSKRPISSYPVKGTEDKDAPIVIWEMPISNPPYGLYVAGVDPYRQNEAQYSDSLGAVYIFKRMHDISGEKLQDAFVASYVARPKDKGKWEEQARLLIKYYNAQALCENDEMSFIDYMVSMGDEYYLCPQPAWLKSIVPNTTVKRDFGIHRSSDTIRDHLRGKFKTYMEERLHVERDEKGSVIREVFGVSRILDPMLCEEIGKWNSDGNFDREVAASLAIAQARHMDPRIGKVNSDEADPRYKSYFEKNKNKPQLFQETRTPSRHKTRIKRLFK